MTELQTAQRRKLIKLYDEYVEMGENDDRRGSWWYRISFIAEQIHGSFVVSPIKFATKIKNEEIMDA